MLAVSDERRLQRLAPRLQEAAMPRARMILRSRDVPRPRIVVADDDADMRDLIALMLDHRGFDALGVADGEAVITAILSEGADGVVSDLQMRGLDGLTLCRVLRALRASAALPIVVFTGVAEDDARLVALRDINEVEVLHKPLGLREIAPLLTAMIPTTAPRIGAAPKASRVLGRSTTTRSGVSKLPSAACQGGEAARTIHASGSFRSG